MSYENLPGTFPYLIDGNLVTSSANQNPRVLVIGTAARGNSDVLTQVNSPSQAAADFGKSDGTLIRGMYEVLEGGAENIALLRIGGKSAILEDIGGAGGITVTTISQDDNAGTDYTVFWDDSEERLRVYRASDDLLVYDNNPAYPSGAVDEQEVTVDGDPVGLPGSGLRADIGTSSVPITLAAADGIGGASFTAGTDGILMSRMELFEELYKTYQLLENEDIDIVIPMNVYLDDLNVADMTTAEITALNTSTWSGQLSYPTPGASNDALGRVFVQEYEGQFHFWWDMNGDGVAEIWPSAGTANPTTDAEGVSLTVDDFHEANFAYQLADFCYRDSENNQEKTGVIGTRPPSSWSLKDISVWIGKVPTTTTDGSGYTVVSSNGTGLLGNKWVAGRRNNAGTGLLGHSVGGIEGLADGGFIATDTGWPDGTQQEDRNEHLIDIGKYLSIIPSPAIFSNPTQSTSYVASGAPYYAGFYSALKPASAPTNKVISGIRLPFRVATSKLDALAGKRYVMYQQKAKGNVVADAPVASRPDSDYRRLTTMMIVKSCIDAVRSAADAFLGEGVSGPRLAALETAIEQALLKKKKDELQRYDVAVTATPTQQVLGQANVELVLVPMWELRQITVNVALAAK